METQVNKMEPQSGKFPQALIWIAGIALTLFCAVGIAAVMGWIPNSLGGPADTAALQAQSAIPPAPAAAKPRPAAVKHAAPAAVAVAPVAVAPVAAATCAECGVIESVREVASKGQGSGLGAVGGGVLGGLLGNQVGGAVAGNEVEKRVKATKSYEITVRLDNGTSRVISEATQPSWRNGDKVRIVNGAIRSNA